MDNVGCHPEDLKTKFSTVECPNKGHFETNIDSIGFSPLLSSFKRFQSHYIDRGIIFGDLVLSIVERYLIQCAFLGWSYLRYSNVVLKFVVVFCRLTRHQSSNLLILA